VIIDEYARATSNLNGLCLFQTLVEAFTDASFLSEIQNKKAKLPLALLSTNMKELFSSKVLPPLTNLSVVMMSDQHESNAKDI
jgi:hypothetical protein